MTRRLTTVNKEKQTVRSPVATPFMNGDTRELLGVPRERLICSLTCTYLQITQSRDWLPDPIGGVVWLGYDNPAATPHLPIYIGSTKVAPSFMVDGRREYRRDSAWWAFRTVAKLAQFRWQEMSVEIQKIWQDLENQAFAKQDAFEKEITHLYRKNPKKACRKLTEYTVETLEKAVSAYWKLSDELWVKYSRHF
jgi:dipeptidase